MAAPEFQTYEVDGLGGWEGDGDYWVGAGQEFNCFASVACVETTGGSARCKVVMEGVREQIQCGRLGSLQVFPLSCLVSAAFFS